MRSHFRRTNRFLRAARALAQLHLLIARKSTSRDQSIRGVPPPFRSLLHGHRLLKVRPILPPVPPLPLILIRNYLLEILQHLLSVRIRQKSRAGSHVGVQECFLRHLRILLQIHLLTLLLLPLLTLRRLCNVRSMIVGRLLRFRALRIQVCRTFHCHAAHLGAPT